MMFGGTTSSSDHNGPVSLTGWTTNGYSEHPKQTKGTTEVGRSPFLRKGTMICLTNNNASQEDKTISNLSSTIN